MPLKHHSELTRVTTVSCSNLRRMLRLGYGHLSTSCGKCSKSAAGSVFPTRSPISEDSFRNVAYTMNWKRLNRMLASLKMSLLNMISGKELARRETISMLGWVGCFRPVEAGVPE